jgi:hypothetical protein
MNLRFIAAIVCTGFLLLAGCRPLEQSRREEEAPSSVRKEEPKAPLSTYEKTFNPARYDQEIRDVQGTHEITEGKGTVRSEEDSLVVESEIAQGFRIQIFATPNIDEANAMKMAAAQSVIEDSIYVVFDPPLYKVRLGDFQTRVEANQKLATLVDKGFPDAWVVSDRIVLRKSVRVRASEIPPIEK